MEIERKFLISEIPDEALDAPGTDIEQGYLVLGGDGAEARVRRTQVGCTLTIKSGRGLIRRETEIALSDEQFQTLWPATEHRRVTKTRHRVQRDDGLTIELDVYGGRLTGLVVVEVEFDSEAAAVAFSPPAWFHTEVTADEAYKNRRLAVDGRP